MNFPISKQSADRNAPVVIKPFLIIEKELDEVRTFINKELRYEPGKEDIRVLFRHIQARSAKLLRPGLVLLSGLCCGNCTDEHIKAAVIFEMIHNATLLHDDVIDQAKKRRGNDTVNMLYGNELAVLLGDFLLSKVFSISTKLNNKTAEIIALAAEKTCGGEINQNLQRHNWKLSERKYIQIITDKTAAMFKYSCLAGAQISGADRETSDALAEFGLNFGIAFQLADDLLDLISDEQIMGKTGGDLENANATLPLIKLISITPENQRTNLINKLLKASQDNTVLDEVNTMLKEKDCLNYTKQKIKEYKSLAIDAVSKIENNVYKKAIIETINYIRGL